MVSITNNCSSVQWNPFTVDTFPTVNTRHLLQHPVASAVTLNSVFKIPALRKHFLIVSALTLSQSSATHLMAQSTFTDSTILNAVSHSSIFPTTCDNSILQYLILNACNMPRSSGCKHWSCVLAKRLFYVAIFIL